MIYAGQELDNLDLWALGNILGSLEAAEKRREEASKHLKFDKTKNKQAMKFPSPNPEFLKLKDEVQRLIRKKQGND